MRFFNAFSLAFNTPGSSQPHSSVPSHAPKAQQHGGGSTASRPNKRTRLAKSQATEAGIGPSVRSQKQQAQREQQAVAVLAAAHIPATYNPQHPEKPAKAPLTGAADCWQFIIGTVYKDRPAEPLVNKAKRVASVHTSLQRPAASCTRSLCVLCL